jgi:hypothetical protein
MFLGHAISVGHCIAEGSTLDLDQALLAATAGDAALADRALDQALLTPLSR